MKTASATYCVPACRCPAATSRYYVGLNDEVFSGFLEQTLQQPSGRVTEHNHTLQMAIYSKLAFRH